MSNLSFPGWSEPRPTVFIRETAVHRFVVARFDSYNWGWACMGQNGVIVAGRHSSNMTPFDAVSEASAYLATITGQRPVESID